jgi:transcriptional regulator with XRE-family HTH domain
VGQLIDELVRRRREAGLTQTQVADLIGTSQRTLSQLENRAQEPKLGTAVAWALAVGLRLSWNDDELPIDTEN